MKNLVHNYWILAMALIIGFTGSCLAVEQVFAQDSGPDIQIESAAIKEGQDYATRVLGLRWDMQSPPYPDFATVFRGIERSSFSQSSSGIWNFQSTNATPPDPTIQLLPFEIYEQGQPAVQFVMKFGVKNPIIPSIYQVLHLRIRSSVQDYVYLYWFPEPEWTQARNSGPYTIYPGWNDLVIDLSNNPQWTGLSKIVGLRLDPATTNPSVSFELDWVRLTPKATNSVDISWAGVNTAQPLYFYANRTCTLTDAIPLGLLNNPSANGTWTWGSSWIADATRGSTNSTYYMVPASLEPGSYQLFALSNNTGTPQCTTLEIIPDSIMTIARPSMRSGPEYSSDALGNAWDFSDSSDVQMTVQINNPIFSNGIFSGTSVAMPFMQGDASIYLNYSNSTLIDTSKYKYFTFRMKLDGNQDVYGGWVARVFWWHSVPTAATFGTTKDIVLYEGWQEYTLDLSQASIAYGPGWTGLKNQIRFDPHESWNPLAFYLDDIQLRSDDHIRQGDIFTVVYSANNAQSIVFYYDTDRDASSGQTVMEQYIPPAPISGSNHLFLPLTSKGGRLLPDGNHFDWDTQNVNPGVYYVCADVNNGYATTHWCSETPVYIDG
jgi:hypothetical protein